MKFKSIKSILSVFISAILVSSCGTSSNYCTVTFDSHGGSNVPSQKVAYGDKVNKPDDPTRLGYNFVNWTYQDEKWSFIGYSVTQDMTLDANWSIITYNIIYEFDGGIVSSPNPTTYTVEDSFTLNKPTRTGYTFLGWFNETNSEIKSLGQTIVGDMTLTAHWSANLNKLSVTSEDASKGTVSITSGNGYSDESITVVATPVGDCVFKGWYHDDTKVSDDATYTFIMPTSDYSLVAHFFTKAEAEEAWNISHGVIPTLSGDGKTITYGLYPQTNVNDSSLVSALNALTIPESNGWYLYEGEYYSKASAYFDSNILSIVFDNGTTMISGTTYWFKCEPITWKILSNTDGKYYILSSVLLDAHCYNNSTSNRTIDGKTVYPNNYEYSDIRTWLNNDFYNSAFALGNSHIQTTTVDNSASTTETTYNTSACNNTQDKVFLPSYKDYINSSYGFSDSTSSTNTRYCRTTDWARAKGAYFDRRSSSLYNGEYWTRSPRYSFSGAWYVSDVGNLDFNYGFVDNTCNSVRPALTIKIA